MGLPWDDFDTLLGSVVVIWTLVAGVVITIFTRALAQVVTGFFSEDARAKRDGRAARSVVGGGVDLFGVLISTIVQVLMQTVTMVIGILSYFLVLLVFAAGLHVIYLYFPVALGSVTSGWNSSVGQFWSEYVIGALEAVQMVFEKLIGFYNFGVFVVLKIPFNLFIHMVTTGYDDLFAVGGKLGHASVALYKSFDNYQEASLAQCGNSVVRNSINTSCVRPELRQIDLVTPLTHVNQAMAHVMDFLPRTCTVLQQPARILLFPFISIESSRSIHHLFNAIQHFFLQMTALSVKRWELGGVIDMQGGRTAIAMPDIGPVLDHLSASCVHFGRMVDNWIDVVIFAFLTIGDPSKELDCDNQRGTWQFPTAGISSSSFGSNHTVLTQLTPSMFALSDGYTIEYHHHGRRANTRISTEAWPIPVNITYGIAAIAYARDLSRDDNVQGHTTALMGCSCVDSLVDGIRVFCAIAPYELFDGLKASAFVVNMTWEVANTPKRMVCRDTKIAVESIRYQSQRITSPNELRFYPALAPPTTCMTKGTCTRIDAAIWIMPICPLSTRVRTKAATATGACLRALKDFSCFPFCVGVHRSFAANERIVIRSSSAWERNVLLTSRDCTLEQAETFKPVSSQVLERSERTLQGTWIPAGRVEDVAEVQIRTEDSNAKCVVQQGAVSSVPLLKEELFESSQMFVEQHLKTERGWEHAQDSLEQLYRFQPTDAMLLERQPFVFAGDMAVRTMTTCPNGILWEEGNERECTTVVDVMQLTGNEYNEFTLRHIVPGGIGVTRRPDTISRTEEVLAPGRVTLPPVIVRSVYLHNPAAATYDAFWYAVNPDFEMLHCVLRYCNGFGSLENCLQFVVLSNYESIRIWKVIPQAGCTRNPVSGHPECPPQTAQSVTMDADEFNMRIGTSSTFDVGRFCSENVIVNLYVEDMEELDPLNMAVAVRRGNSQALYHSLWGEVGDATKLPVSSTVYYFINTQTMEIREGKPWVEAVSTGVSSGYLCSNARIGPSLGSAWGETMSSVFHFVKPFLTTLLNIPGLIWLYKEPNLRCSRSRLSLYHSFYEDCGTKYLDLGDAFDAINRANVHAWEILDFMSNALQWAIQDEKSPVVEAVSLYLRGERMYKENRVLLSRTALTSSGIAVADFNQQRFATTSDAGGDGSASMSVVLGVGTPKFMAGMSVGIHPIAYAEYFWRLLTRVIDRMMVISHEGDGRNAVEVFRYVLGNVTLVWYESVYSDWDDIISTRTRRACTGVSLMVGYSNPWARFLRHWCLAGVEYTDGILHALAGFMVEVPVTVCVCIRSTDHDFKSFVRDVCVPETAPTLRPLLVTMLAWQEDIETFNMGSRQSVMQTVCSQTLNLLEDSVYNAFTPWADQHTEAGLATTSLFDYLGVLMQQESAQCTNFATNPLVSVIVPTPIDYFRACASTAICRARCKPYRDMLDTAVARHNGNGALDALSFHTNVESSMFQQFATGTYEDSYMRLIAVAELPVQHDDCAKCNHDGDDCVSVVGMENGKTSVLATRITVRAFCIPISFNQHVYQSHTWYIEDDTESGEAVGMASIEAALDSDDGGTQILRVAYSMPYGDHVVMLSRVSNVPTSGKLYVGSVEQLTVWRSSNLLGFSAIASGPSIVETCSDAISAGIKVTDVDPLQDGEDSSGYAIHLVSTKIMDFFIVPGTEYTIDMIVQMDVNAEIIRNEQSSSTVVPVYIRLSWCEFLPPNFHGIHRSRPSECFDIQSNTVVCQPLPVNETQELFHVWLRAGIIIHLPWRDENLGKVSNIFVPRNAVGGSSLYSNILPVNISLSKNILHIDATAPEFLLTSGTETRRMLPNRGYCSETEFQGISALGYEGIRTSMVAHFREDFSVEGSYDTNTPALGLWYATTSPVIARSWLREVRYNPRLFTLQGLASRKHDMNIQVQRYCNGYSCSGCATLQLRQVCAALQNCITMQCIGTTVNHGSILCNAGLMLEALYSEAVGMYISMWHAVSSLTLAIVRESAETPADLPYTFRVEFTSEIAYTLACETKDILATFTSLFATLLQVATSADGGVTQRSDVVAYGLKKAQNVNTAAYSEAPLQVAAFHQFLYQIFLGPIYFGMAVYRWGFCTISNIISIADVDVAFISLGDMNTTQNGATWGACTSEVAVAQILSATRSTLFFENMASLLRDTFEDEELTEQIDQSENAFQYVEEAQDVGVQSFSVVTNKLRRGAGRRFFMPTELLIHLFDAAMTWLSGVLTGVQDLIYNFDSANCRVPDITVQDAVQCACGDTAASVVPNRRNEGVEQGALWCSGMLYMPLDDGTFGYVYNPYSLAELGERLYGMDTYLECISTTTQAGCIRPQVGVFDERGINPMSVLTRCRSNYMQQQWDIGAHALFDTTYTPPVDAFSGFAFKDAQNAALAWAAGVGLELHTCVTAAAKLPEDFAACKDVFLRLRLTEQQTIGSRSETYFAYRVGVTNERPNTNPDACMLYTGPATNAGSEESQTRFQMCIDDEKGNAELCDLPALGWAGNMHSRVPVAVVHREAITDQAKRLAIAQRMHEAASLRIKAAFDEFDPSSLEAIDAIFFSAEGDALHQMMDCMFLGPYAKVDYLATDKEGLLPDLAWFRDAGGGKTRRFDLPCDDEKLHGDEEGAPFTCGSPARRAIIKQYVRGEFLAGRDAANVTASLILDMLQNISAQWQDVGNYGCLSADGTEIGIQHCGGPRSGDKLQDDLRFKPELSTFWEVPSRDVVASVTQQLPSYFQSVMTNASKWTQYYTDNVYTELWGLWNESETAEYLHLFAPHEPIISYNKSENMNVLEGNSLKNSLWGVCTSLVSQPMLTVPLTRYSEDGTGQSDAGETEGWMPRFMRELPLGPFDPFSSNVGDTNAVEKWMTALLEEAWKNSPMYSHYVMRYVPSTSSICTTAKQETVHHVEHTLLDNVIRFSNFLLHEPGGSVDELIEVGEDVHIRFVSFYARTLGSVTNTCPCSLANENVDGSSGVSKLTCVFAREVCDKLVANILEQNLNITTEVQQICAVESRSFRQDSLPQIWLELNVFGKGVPCHDMDITDQWGLFPYNEDNTPANEAWVMDAAELKQSSVNMQFDASQLYAQFRGGISPVSLKHVLESVRKASIVETTHAGRVKPIMDPFSHVNDIGGTVAQHVCEDANGNIETEQGKDTDNLIDDFIHGLFPVAQLVYEPAGVSTCTRFVIEFVKLLFMQNVLKSSNVGAQEISVETWRNRCRIKVKQCILCKSLGVVDIIPNRIAWRAILPPDCMFELDYSAFEKAFGLQFYITPGCAFYARGEWFNLRRCIALNNTTPLSPRQLVPKCSMQAHSNIATEGNPFLFTHGNGHGVLHWGDGSQFAGTAESEGYMQTFERVIARADVVAESKLAVDLSRSFVHALFGNIMDLGSTMKPLVFGNTEFGENTGECSTKGILECTKAEFCDKVFDWWPEESDAPYGYHATATCLADENAYRTFDSYIAFDREAMEFAYEHTALRHAPGFYQTIGMGGLCRLHSINMPLVETNTHRVCTQNQESMPNPALPFERGSHFKNAFSEGSCTTSSKDVPWDTKSAGGDIGPWYKVVGNIHGMLRMSSARDGAPGRNLLIDKFPPVYMLQKDTLSLQVTNLQTLVDTHKHVPLLPLAGVHVDGSMSDPWEGCVQPLEVVTCNLRDSESCPSGMNCAQHPGGTENVGICLPRPGSIGENEYSLPCYRSDMCADTDHCLAKGYCGKVKMHLWNTAGVPLEFTTLIQDTCGIETPDQFPFTQTFEGASPWEILPDLLQGHGLCAQRHQYAYKYAMKHIVEERNGDEKAYLRKRQAESAESRRFMWPWVQQGPSGKLLDEGRDSLLPEDVNFMHLHPHPCDRTYMHTENLKVCSLNNGDQDISQIPYKIQRIYHNITGRSLGWAKGEDKTTALKQTHWMRTTDPWDKDRVLIGALFDSEVYSARGAFAFLGGDKDGNISEYAGAVGTSNAKFVHCSTLEMCGLPTFTFNGANSVRGAFVGGGGTWKQFEAGDYASCGSIGFLRSASGDECTFDIALFPIIRLLVSGSSIFCTDIFGVPDGSLLDANTLGVGVVNVVQLVLDLGPKCDIGQLCCLGGVGEDDVECKYRAVGLDDSASADGKMPFAVYENMIGKINSLHLFGTISADFANKMHTAEGLGIITECIEDLVRVNRRNQNSFANAKYSAKEEATSGLYHVLGFHLYEVPWLWYYKWVYKNIVISTQSLGTVVATARTEWNSIVSLGEAWTSRTDAESTSVRRCNQLRCMCGTEAAVRNALLCVNSGLRLRVVSLTEPDTTPTTHTQWDMDSEVKSTYFAVLRKAIRDKVFSYVNETFGMSETSPQSFVPGCHTTATWNITRCRESDFCMLFLVQNATGMGNDAGFDFDARNPFFYDYFEYDGYQSGISTCVNMLQIINDLVDSYQFIDEEFEPLDSAAPSYMPDIQDTVWKFPLFRLLDEPIFQDPDPVELDADHCTTGNGWQVIDHRDPLDDKECIFNEEYTRYESAADPEVSQRPNVIFADLEDIPIEMVVNKVELDVCSENSNIAEFHDAWHDGEKRVRMSCSFQDDPALHGKDFCDMENPNQYKRVCFYEPPVEHGFTFGFKKTGRPASAPDHEFYHCLGILEHMRDNQNIPFTSELIAKLGKVGGTWRKASPQMRCTDTPWFTTNCQGKTTLDSDDGSLVKEYYGNWVRFEDEYQRAGENEYNAVAPWKTELLKQIRDETLATFTATTVKDGNSIVEDIFGTLLGVDMDSSSSVVTGLQGWGDSALTSLLGERSSTTTYSSAGLSLQCPAHIDPWVSGVSTENVDEETFEQEHDRRSMCHRLQKNSPCFPHKAHILNELFEDTPVTGKSPCKISRVVLPPGVAGRFYTTTTPVSLWPQDKRRPVWSECPNDDEEDTVLAARVPLIKKSQSKNYNSVSPQVSGLLRQFESTGTYKKDTLIKCTRQRTGTCTTNDENSETDANCFILSENKKIEWKLSENARCNELGGICQWSLTLAEGFFCGTGTAEGRNVLPPPKQCPNAEDHKYLVRGSETQVRSLWKCAECVKYSPLQYRGEMRCGFKDPYVSSVSHSPEHIVNSVKEYIRQNIHSIANMRDLHRNLEYPDLAYAGDPEQPSFPTNEQVAYINLMPLTFAKDFENWGHPEDNQCLAGVPGFGGETVDVAATNTETCSWTGVYDVNALRERDNSYFNDIAVLECAVDSPELHEYAQCSAIGNEPREMLREWVEKNYRKEQGTWLPILQHDEGVGWLLDRSAVANPFTVMFASQNRPQRQKYVENVLSDTICAQNSVLSGMCAKITNTRTNVQYVRHVNPWLGGEFNTDLVGRTEDGMMGLDQCLRQNQLWEGCCSCFPVSMCCYPEKECKEGESVAADFVYDNNYFGASLYRKECNLHDFEYPPAQPVGLADPTNICVKDPFEYVPSICTHRQGIAGGGTGLPLTTIQGLYHEEQTTNTYRIENFFRFSDGITVWAGASTSSTARVVSGQHTMLRMPDELMYPTHMILKLGSTGALNVHAYRFESDPTLGLDEVLVPAVNWVPGIMRAWADDHAKVKRLYPSLAYTAMDAAKNPAWYCPLKTVSFWGKHSPGFNPLLPDPIRADFMFGGGFYCRQEANASDPYVEGGCMQGIHPFHTATEYNGLRDFSTLDGLCFYDASVGNIAELSKQTVAISDRTHPCGLRQKIAHMVSGAWQRSHVMSSSGDDCTEILDWPAQPLPFRSKETDKRSATYDHSEQRCAVLPRVAAFRMKYLSNASLQKAYMPSKKHPNTTMGEGGDCHMGRATRIDSTTRDSLRQYEHCVTVARTSTQAHIRCTAHKDNGGRLTAADRVFVLEREIKQRPLEDVVLGPAGKAPTKCSQCDAAKIPTRGPGTSKLQYAETSVGSMHRLSGTRFLANELLRACKGKEACSPNQAAWSATEFLSTLLLHPHELIEDAEPLESTQTLAHYISELPAEADSTVDTADDTHLWNKPWVLCRNDTCTGSIRKQAWKADRYGQCWAALGNAIEKDETETFARSIRICDITGSLQTLCDELVNAMRDIENANCIGSTEECEILGSFYTPAQYFVTNKAFSRETIRDFYMSQAADACDGEEERLQTARAENVIVQQQCWASSIEVVKEALQFARLSVRLLLGIVTSLYTIVSDFLMMPFYVGLGQDIEPLMRDIMHHVLYILRVVEVAISQLFDLFIYLVSTISTVGTVLSEAFSHICKVVSVMWYICVELVWCQYIRAKLLWVMSLISEIIAVANKAASWLHIGFLSGALETWATVNDAVLSTVADIPCPAVTADVGSEIKARFEDSCKIPSFDENAFVQENAYVATRCWANPSLGNLLSDQHNLACSAGDTCIIDGVGDDLGVCESCPPVIDVGSFARYGCDLLLRKCRCGVQLQARTPCLRNSDCMQNVPCKLLSNIDATSYGNTDCMQSCPNEPVCLIENGNAGATGECTCLMDRVKTHGCDTPGSLVVMPIDQGACLLARDPSLARSISVFSTVKTQITNLALAPCALTKNRVCHNVQTTTGATQSVIVGTDILSIPSFLTGQRRLLWDEPTKDLSSIWVQRAVQFVDDSIEWDPETTGICAALVLENGTTRTTTAENATCSLGVFDRSLLQECVKWRAVYAVAKDMFGLNITREERLLSFSGTIGLVSETAFWVDVIRQPTAYAEAAFYAFSQMECADSVSTAVRQAVAMCKRFWIFHVLPVVWRTQEKWKQERKQNVHINRTINSALGALQYVNFTTSSSTAQNWLNTTLVLGKVLVDEVIPPSVVQKIRVYQEKERHLKSIKPNVRSLLQVDLVQEASNGLGISWPIDWDNVQVWQELDGPVCELFDIGYASILQMWNATIVYYEKGYGNRTNISQHVMDTLMHVPALSDTRKQERREFVHASQSGIPEIGVLDGLLRLVVDTTKSLFGIGTDEIISFFDPEASLQEQIEKDMFTLPRVLEDLTHCNLERIMTCDTTPRALVPTFLLSLGIFWVAGQILWFLPSGLSIFAMVTLFPGMVMWYAYGYSPMCTPMVPTCFMADLVSALRMAFPAKIEWPALLIDQVRCTRDGVPLLEEDRGHHNCFKSCASDDFRFYSWEDPFAWFFCEFDRDACQHFATWIRNQTTLGTTYQQTSDYFVQVLEFDNYHLTEAHRMCGFLTGFYIIPAFLIAVLCVLMTGTVITSVFIVALKTLVFLITSVGVSDPENGGDQDGDSEDDENEENG